MTERRRNILHAILVAICFLAAAHLEWQDQFGTHNEAE